MNSWHDVLGLERGKSYDVDTIKQTYKKLCHEFHPDKGGNSDRFIEINRAYKEAIKECSEKSHEDLFWDLLRKNKSNPLLYPFSDELIKLKFEFTVEELKNGMTVLVPYKKSVPCEKCKLKQGLSCSRCSGIGYTNITETMSLTLKGTI